MKKSVCIICFCILSSIAWSINNGSPYGVIDERIELVGTVFRLAGAEEFSMCEVESYVSDIDTYFQQYEKHPLIEYIKELRATAGIGYGLVPLAALYTEIKDGHITKRCNGKYKIYSVSRWTEKTFDKYVRLLDDFYKESNYHEFYMSHKKLFAEAERLFAVSGASNVDTAWFKSTYGVDHIDKSLYISLVNGGSNFSIEHGVDAVVIGGFYTSDRDEGSLIFNHAFGDAIVHELTHMFVGDVVMQYQEATLKSAKTIYGHLDSLLYANGYYYNGLWSEWVTRVATLLYMMDNNPRHQYAVLLQDRRQGFIWQERTFRFLDNYMENRDRYRHFQDFVPQLAAYFNYTAENFERVMWEHENRRPYVVDVFPVPGTDIDLAAQDTIRIRFSFSEEMGTHCYGVRPSGLLSPRDCDNKPGRMAQCRWTDNRTFEYAVPAEWYEKCDTLAFKLDRRAIQDRFVNGIEEDYEVYYPLKH